MAVVWIVTTGNSDVIMTSKDDWEDLKREKKLGQVYNQFEESKLQENKDGEICFSLPARALGTLYEDKLDDEYWETLRFPLLKGFVAKLKAEGKQLSKIIMVLTNQDLIFDINKANSSSPCWQDTCKLESIFKHYFAQELNDIQIEPIYLRPKEGGKGLDDWDTTLQLVQEAFGKLEITADEVFVSHQAGTPAISSAVQFVSLYKFGGKFKVSFLSSNERSEEVNLTEYSSYFQSMQMQEAKKLLENYNYVGVESVLKDRLKADDREAKNILALLEVAKLWNLSKFDGDFKKKMESLDIEYLRESATSRFNESWAWWIAYEEAYLAVVRRKQENIVEAFFHSFRAFEGIFAEWGKKTFNSYIDFNRDVPYLNADVLNDPQDYLSGSKLKDVRETIEKDGGIDLELMTLCKIFKVKRSNYRQKCPDLITFWDNKREKRISARRNFIFHQIQGVSKEKLLEFWNVNSDSEWEDLILKFLNFIAERTFESWQEASLMARVHQELVKAIDDL